MAQDGTESVPFGPHRSGESIGFAQYFFVIASGGATLRHPAPDRQKTSYEVTSMKLYALCAAVTLGSTAAVAGNMIFETQAEPELVLASQPAGEPGSSGAWLIPLLAIGLVAVAVSQDDEFGEEEPAPA
jgi:hypothetical protein